eukprot:TRINITY_DN51_c0_g1_i3.p1 TRINITY_DN51_c0_g1~~TRINITY_DN51_c0_g1_i3.p1  ORF type:complete len:497 (-),score=107.76 TRINITY_DN51_c0_g1_i3:158-1573(-)
MGAKWDLDKLENTNNFGADGKVVYKVQGAKIVGEITADKLKDSSCDIFQMSLEEADATTPLVFSALSKASVDALKKWAEDPHHVILGFQSFCHAMDDGYSLAKAGAKNPMEASKLGGSIVDSGPFGSVGKFNQGGSWQGTIDEVPASACTLIKDQDEKPIMTLDVNLGSVFVSDVDLLTTLGGISKSAEVSSANDKLLGNLYAFMIGIVCNGPPADCEFMDKPFTVCETPKGEASKPPAKPPAPVPSPPFAVPVVAVVKITIVVKLTIATSAELFVSQCKSAFAATFSFFHFATLTFRLRFAGSFSWLGGLTGRRLGELQAGSEIGVEAQVDDAPDALQVEAMKGSLADKIKDNVEDKIEGSEVTEQSASATANNEPAGNYKAHEWGTVCRRDKSDVSTDNHGVTFVDGGPKSVMECSEKCNSMGDGCHAFEYRISEGRCEIHPQPVCHVAEQNPAWFAPTPKDFGCYIKC